MRNYFLAICLMASVSASAQENGQTDTISNFSKFKRDFKISGFVQTRYIASFTNNVDVDGKNFTDDKGVTNAFQLKRIRVMFCPKINDYFDANILVNFADFSSDPKNKVLENAFIRYSRNRFFHVQAGQLRPYFGIEDIIPAEFVKSLDYSNSYTAFSNSGWQGFQMGLSVYGDITGDGKMPLKYYAGLYNGNNRNQPSDNDNSKNAYARMEAEVLKNVTVGANAAYGTCRKKSGNAWGADVNAKIPLSDKLKLELQGEYKDGTNFALFQSLSNEGVIISTDSVRMKGFYILPNLRYELKNPRLRAIEFSSRYEYFDDNYKIGSGNLRQTIIPMVNFEFADDAFICLQMGVMIDLYKRDNVPNTTIYDHNTGIVQLQVRF